MQMVDDTSQQSPNTTSDIAISTYESTHYLTNLLHTSISKLMPVTSDSDNSITHHAILQQIVEQIPLDATTDTPVILHLTEAVK